MSEELARTTNAALSRANLLRMRGLWTEAAEQCAEVLRLDPRNPTAHSLLGDIYQNQGRMEDARHWYQLALEVNPASRADRAKLDRVEETLAARNQRAEWEAVIEGRQQPVTTTLLVRESVQRVVAMAGAAVCAVILVMATLISLSERTQAQGEEGPLKWIRPPPPPPRLGGTPRGRPLMKRIADAAPGSQGQLVRVELDPRRWDTASLRVFLPRSALSRLGGDETRQLAMREGYRFAFALHDAEHSFLRISVLVVGPVSGTSGDADALFAGDLASEDLVVSPNAVSAAELERFYVTAALPRTE
jgi:hypothetical protein